MIQEPDIGMVDSGRRGAAYCGIVRDGAGVHSYADSAHAVEQLDRVREQFRTRVVRDGLCHLTWSEINKQGHRHTYHYQT